MTQYRKKPVVIEAVQFDGTNYAEIDVLVGKPTNWDGNPDWFLIQTLEGEMTARVGDWIIKGVQGELYPCKPDIFEQTYDEVEV